MASAHPITAGTTAIVHGQALLVASNVIRKHDVPMGRGWEVMGSWQLLSPRVMWSSLSECERRCCWSLPRKGSMVARGQRIPGVSGLFLSEELGCGRRGMLCAAQCASETSKIWSGPLDGEFVVEIGCGVEDRRSLVVENYEDRCHAGRETGQRRVGQLPSVEISLSDIAALYDYPLDQFQQSAITGLLEGLSLVVCAPTSSGKTLIAEAAAAIILSRRKRLFYTTPLKALSNQKLREFRELFGEENVGLLTGEAAVNRKAPIMVMTTEILRNMLYESVGSTGGRGRLRDVDVVVLDEVHYLSDISRGTVWEETIIYCPKEVQLICLSATVANPADLAGWINQVHGPTKLVTSSSRPVPLQWHYSTRQYLLPLLNEDSTAMNPKVSIKQGQKDKGSHPFWDHFREGISSKEQPVSLKTSLGFKGKDRRGDKKRKNMERKMTEEELIFLRQKQVPQIKHTLMQLKERDMLPAIWFIFSRKGCDTAVSHIKEINLLSENESEQVQEALKNFERQYPKAKRDMGVNSLLCGAAAHHAGCLPTWKSFIEELFQKGLVKVVFSTETLAAGINMPARTAVISSMSKRGDDGHALLSSNAMLQMAGRAGRRGIDNQGHVVVVQTAFEGAEECCEVLLAGPEPLVSQFTTTYGMVLNLLAGPRIANQEEKSEDNWDAQILRRGRNLEEARSLIEQSFGNFMGTEFLVSTQRQLTSLQQDIERLMLENPPVDVLTSVEGKSKHEQREFETLSKQARMKQRGKISKLQSKRSSLTDQIKQLESSGWKVFQQVVSVLQSAGALHTDATSLLPIGEVAAAIRGTNELGLALAFTSDHITSLKPSQLAAACGTLVSEGMKARAKDNSSTRFSISRGVSDWVIKMEDLLTKLLRLQAIHGVEMPFRVDKKFAGVVEAWASGVSWQDLIENSGMDEGDIARLLRRSLDLLSQIPHLPHIDPVLRKTARAARAAMDRPPISELVR